MAFSAGFKMDWQAGCYCCLAPSELCIRNELVEDSKGNTKYELTRRPGIECQFKHTVRGGVAAVLLFGGPYIHQWLRTKIGRRGTGLVTLAEAGPWLKRRARLGPYTYTSNLMDLFQHYACHGIYEAA